MENEVRPKKQEQTTMNRSVAFYITLWSILMFSKVLFAQEVDPVDKRWEQMNQRIEYVPSNNPDGPVNRYSSPPNMNEGGSPLESRNYNPSKPSDEDIVYSREKRYNSGSEKGVERRIKGAEKDELDDLSKPDTDAPDIDAPDWDGPNLDGTSSSFWKFLFIAIGVILLAFIIYHLFFKNANKNKDIGVTPANYEDEDLDPSTIQRTQLEIDLDEAIEKEDYRLAVRILYTMNLKALVEKNWIVWEKKKTNYNYLLEMNTRKEREDFDKSIRVFEWVWYGKNIPEKPAFDNVLNFYQRFLKQLNNE